MRTFFIASLLALSFCAGSFTGCGGGTFRPGLAPVVGLAMEHVVEVRTKALVMHPGIDGAIIEPTLEDAGSGSAIIVDKRGYLLTCWHVVSDCAEVQVDLDWQHLGVNALVVAKDEVLDLALLKVDLPTLDVVTWGNSASLMVGDTVFAVGFPFHLGKMARAGIVSTIRFAFRYPLIGTDAAINPGDSGGGLFDCYGHLVGVNNLLYSPTHTNLGIAGCIPGNTARLFVQRNIPLE